MRLPEVGEYWCHGSCIEDIYKRCDLVLASDVIQSTKLTDGNYRTYSTYKNETDLVIIGKSELLDILRGDCDEQ